MPINDTQTLHIRCLVLALFMTIIRQKYLFCQASRVERIAPHFQHPIIEFVNGVYPTLYSFLYSCLDCFDSVNSSLVLRPPPSAFTNAPRTVGWIRRKAIRRNFGRLMSALCVCDGLLSRNHPTS